MSRASNTINISDISITPIKLKYSATYDSSSFSQYGISVFSGSNGPISNQGGVPQSTLNYYSIKQLFYSNYISGSFPISASIFDNGLQSTAASGTLEADNRYFPASDNAIITYYSIPRQLFGENISRNSLIISSSNYRLIDDGNGNIVDRLSSNTHVGNIIYSQGLAIITNQSYQGPEVGTYYEGGIIFYILQPSDFGYVPREIHGLIASKQLVTGSAVWSDGTATTSAVNGTRSEIGYGKSNTEKIVNQVIGDGQINPFAAGLCYNLSFNGYSDWYLPSLDESTKLALYNYNYPINDLAYGQYDGWTSTQYDASVDDNEAYDANNEIQYKDQLRSVVAIRSF